MIAKVELLSVVHFHPRGSHLLKIGLTGGIASGKSAVGEMFVRLGAHLIQSDAVAHRLMEPDQPVYDEVVRHFGSGILNEDRTINRVRLAEAAFGASKGSEPADGETRVKELNSIVHPAVIAYENDWMAGIAAREPHGIAVVEAALILEAKAAGRFDSLIVVTCRPEQRAERYAQRHGLSLDAARAEVARRMAAQLPDEEKVKAADYVIDNSGTLEAMEQQARQIFTELRQRAG